MYERSAIVLERYMEKILNLNKEYNLKKNNEDYHELINEIEEYQVMKENEIEVMKEFDETVRKIESLQQKQEQIYKSNCKLEDGRNELFKDLGEDSKSLEKKFEKIENTIETNNEQLKQIRIEFVQHLSDFAEKQKERNKCEKEKRIKETRYVDLLQKIHNEFSEINPEDIIDLKEFIHAEKDQIKQETLEIMTKNGKNERVAFNQDVLKKAIEARVDIAEKEAECYVLIYDRMKKLLSECDTETIKLSKHKKALRDTTVKLAFLKAEKEYIVSFLDYERMTTISGAKAHKNAMKDACENFDLDIAQIRNLYELILKEISGKATKKAYTDLYNKTYLRNIEDKEKNFEEEVNQVNIRMGTVINSNYWRIEGIKNIYSTFQDEVSEKFEKDLSEYRIEELEEEQNLEEYNEYNEEYNEEYDSEEEYEQDEYDIFETKQDSEQEDDEEYEEDYDDEYEDEEEIEEVDEEDIEEDLENTYDEEDEDSEYEEEEYEDDEDSIDMIIEKSRKNSSKKQNKKEKEKEKGLFNKLFKK